MDKTKFELEFNLEILRYILFRIKLGLKNTEMELNRIELN